jgi:uncharacterized protein YjdB
MRKLTNYTNQWCRVTFVSALVLFGFGLKAQIGDVIWQEDFNTLDNSIWTVVTGDGTGTAAGTGWGNQELEYYNTPNVYVADVPGESSNKALVLEAKAEAMGSSSFTSGKVQTYGNLSVKYGVIEIRTRVPNLQTGLWPALWMLGTTSAGWPAKGEIDIMEMGQSLAERTRQGYPGSTVNNYVGSNLIFYSADAVSDNNPLGAASIAWDVNYDNPYVSATNMNDRFLVYRMYWSSTSIRFTVFDGNSEIDLYTGPFTISSVSDEFQNPFYFILNLAVGGNFTDAATASQVTATLPAKMYIDYIKVSKWNGEGEVTIGELPAETGTFGVFTDNTPTSDKLIAGSTSDIYAWNNFSEGTTAPYEGDNVIAWATTSANTWFGGGIASRQPVNMSNFVDGNIKFRIKIPANVNFKIGMTDNYTNEKYISFPAYETKYGLVRDGNWGQVTIPISDFAGLLAFQNMNYLFAIVSDGALPANTFQLGLDDIYWEGGGGTTVAVTGVTVTPSSASVLVGSTQQLTATISPSDATNQSVSWSSSNPAIATVSTSGLVTGIAAGSATITVTTQDGNKTATSNITVTSNCTPTTITPYLQVDGGTWQQTNSTTINPGSSVKFGPQPVSGGSWSWNGCGTSGTAREQTVTPASTCAATATYTNSSGCTSTQDFSVTVNTTVAVTGVTISSTSVSISTGGTTQLSATVSPSNATNQSVSWGSSNTSVATVNSSGLVTGVSGGTATITVTTADGAKTATCSVTVTSTSTNIALNKTATASSTENSSYPALYAVDGNTSTRWSSAFSDPQWIMIDLGNTYNVTGAKILWETAASQSFTISISNDASSWTQLYSTTSGTGGTVNYSIAGTGRYIRLYSTARATQWGNSIWEFEVYGTLTTTGCSVVAATGDFSTTVSTASNNPTLTFVPITSGAGNSTCILYYSTSATGTYPGYIVTPNVPYQISASSGQTVYFYYTYSLPSGIENNTAANKNSFAVGSCSTTLKSAGDFDIFSEEAENQIEVYPVPMKDILNLNLNNSNFNRVLIVDVTGKVIVGQKIADNTASLTLDVSKLKNGIYMLRLEGDNKIITRQLVK